MTPGNIIQGACEKNLAIIAITDHNSAENTAAVIAAARQTALCVIPGIEVTTQEEAHIVGLFESAEGALSMQELVYQNLQPGKNDEDTFGIQVMANELDEVEGINERLLIGATSLGVEQVVDGIHERQGLAVAAHIDRESFSLISQLGLIPEGLNLDALEISKRITLQQDGRVEAGLGWEERTQGTFSLIPIAWKTFRFTYWTSPRMRPPLEPSW
jgi:predicted metal-dependent phosphoesterase TrpH